MEKLLKKLSILNMLEEYGFDDEQVETLERIMSEFEDLNSYRNKKNKNK